MPPPARTPASSRRWRPRFEDIGADLLAAEAWRSAANLSQRSGRGVPAADARRRVDTLLDGCGRPCSPALAPP